LDLFCGAGGVAMGLHRAGFDVVGVDLAPQPRYPFPFIQADALSLYTSGFDFIWASPPCQRFSDLGHRNGNADEWPDLIESTRALLKRSGALYTIENVERAPLINPVMLCGTMFPGLRVLRHRLFEANFTIAQPPHGRHPKVHTFDKRKSHFGKTNEMTDFVQVTGGGNCTVSARRDAMGIDWMQQKELNEAIPPAYAEHIGCAAISRLRSARRFAELELSI
jgi:DNA (cytosine-5)-methyltransferase 1